MLFAESCSRCAVILRKCIQSEIRGQASSSGTWKRTGASPSPHIDHKELAATKPYTVPMWTRPSVTPPIGLSHRVLVGRRHLGRDAPLEIRRKVDEAWFWRGALRGRSPCTREGRRPDRPKNREGGESKHLHSPLSRSQISCGCLVTRTSRTTPGIPLRRYSGCSWRWLSIQNRMAYRSALYRSNLRRTV